MSQDLINQITLNCLMNKHQYEKYVTNKISKSIDEEDKKTYKKRILSLTKELISNNEVGENTVAPDVKYAFEQYIKSCIQYFKLMDNNNIIQEKYKELDSQNKKEKEKNVIKEDGENGEDGEEVQKDKIDFEQEEDELEKDNSLWVRSIKMCNPSLDSFITINSTKRQEGYKIG